jgi:3-hydroxyisobutyrate dehydrogenase
MELLASLPITSPVLAGLGRGMLTEHFEPMFPIELVAKDLRYALELAADVDASLPLAEAAGRGFRDAIAAGCGSENIHAIARIR